MQSESIPADSADSSAPAAPASADDFVPCPHCIANPAACPGYGLCHCGCGSKTRLTPQYRPSNASGTVAGQPRKFINGHHNHGRIRWPKYRNPPLTAAQIKEMLR